MRRSPAYRGMTVLWCAVAVLIFVCSVFPVYWMVKTSFQPNSEVRSTSLQLWPETWTLRNYETVLFDPGRTPFLPALGTSLIATTATVLIAAVLAFLAAVAISRFRFKSRRMFIVAILVIQMLPLEAMMVSLYRVLDGWQLLNTILALVLVYTATVLPFTIWTLRGFVDGVPIELEEAAMIDGCSRVGAFFRVTFPLLAPGLVATGVFAFIQAWNEFLIALIVNTDPQLMTLPVWLRTFLALNGTTNWAAIMAGSTLMAIPVVIFFLIVQGRMTSGLVSGAVKG
ncbi:carbohydrate ABC transporter membrane protein 2, CUT1 family [Agrococcus jejuensis]|uniref:Carbohydrate ABC transporter membrane protein 2, CUT1 family n=2 Tax=Agrococcus jejuensis TaxID=399736 RepID=A0A1G8BC42_9MICO|nr:carbohydrate ABC transporter membrane protein 2, CUT1 family [Agrococcus jejuensis]